MDNISYTLRSDEYKNLIGFLQKTFSSIRTKVSSKATGLRYV